MIRDFRARIAIEPNGRLRITESVVADFAGLRRHGIFREIPIVYDYDRDNERFYELQVESARDDAGRAWPHQVERVGANQQIRIGDPNREVTGRQSYALAYTVHDALNGFDEEDELFWNVTGSQWPVPIEQASVEVVLPREGIRRIACYEGPYGSRDPCRSSSTARTASFQATRRLGEGAELTVVVGLVKGIVPEPRPRLVPKRGVRQYFGSGPMAVGGAALTALAGLGWVVTSWWRHGRDRRYTSIYYLTDDPQQETRPPGATDPIVVEFTPPERVRPAHAGLLLDERADPLDATATIVHLAVRGYLKIERRETTTLGVFHSHDWILRRQRVEPEKLFPFERRLLTGLFERGPSVALWQLRNEMAPHLKLAQDDLYADAVKYRWFAGSPQEARRHWVWIGLGVAVLGAVVGIPLGVTLGLALVAVPIVAAGLAMAMLSPAMSRRTAKGSELLRRVLGFRQYVATAETSRQQFNEEQNIFGEYLPYAIVFGCVDKWARAFKGLDTREAVGSWYAGGDGPFSSEEFSRDLQGLASEVSNTVTSTPGSSGGSGFGGGGGAGGGGGGGGGGAW